MENNFRKHRFGAANFCVLIVLALFVTVVSASWIETDNYRIASLILVLWGIGHYMRTPFRPTIGLMGFACLTWVSYVAFRYAAVYLSGDFQYLGGKEGIYLLPAFYMTVGYMIFLYRRFAPVMALAFVAVSMIVVMATVDFSTVFDGIYYRFLFMNNRIHASLAGGMIILAAINVASFIQAWERAWIWRLLAQAACIVTIAVAFVGIYGSQSKGVWVAIALALAVQAGMMLRGSFGRHQMIIGALLPVGLATFVFIRRKQIWETVGPTAESLLGILVGSMKATHPSQYLSDVIVSAPMPESLQVRLKLWYNAYQVFHDDILFGSGIRWYDKFADAHFGEVGFNVLHNGYLELLVRYGLVGLAFYTLLFGWTVAIIYRAVRLGLVPVEVLCFHVASLCLFLVSILTNSNNRLAIGESYMLVAAAFGFCCSYMIQYRSWLKGGGEPVEGELRNEALARSAATVAR